MTKDTLVNHSNENSVKLEKKKNLKKERRRIARFPMEQPTLKHSVDGPVSVTVMSNGGTNCN